MSDICPKFLNVGTGTAARRIAVRERAGAAPGVFWLGGFKSDMKGTKAAALDEWAAQHGRACVRFDYSGHGESSGAFTDGTIGRWLEDSVAVFAGVARGPQVLVGSSMGGWLALLAAEALGDRIAALVGIAAAPDFTEWGYTADEQARLAAGETVLRENPYGPAPTPTHAGFWRDGQDRRCLSGPPIRFDGPVRLLHGLEDREVPPEIATRLAAALHSQDVQILLLKGGDHRLSREQDIALLLRTLNDLA